MPLERKPYEETWGFIHSVPRLLSHTESTFLKFCRQQVAELA